MTTIRQKKELRRYIDHATPDDRLRHCEGMGEVEKDAERKELSVSAVEWIFVLLALAIIAWAIWGG